MLGPFRVALTLDALRMTSRPAGSKDGIESVCEVGVAGIQTRSADIATRRAYQVGRGLVLLGMIGTFSCRHSLRAARGTVRRDGSLANWERKPFAPVPKSELEREPGPDRVLVVPLSLLDGQVAVVDRCLLLGFDCRLEYMASRK